MSNKIYQNMDSEKYKTKRIPVTFSPEEYEQIQLLASKTSKSMSEIIREWSQEGLKTTVGKDNIDIITKIIREQLKDVLQPSMERMIALQVKGCIHSATSGYLNAEAISRFVPAEMQDDVKEVYETARTKAITTIKNKDDDFR